MSRTVIAALDDMFFASKIRAAADHLGVNLRSVRNADVLISAARESSADLMIVDLHTQGIDPIAVATTLKSDERLRLIALLGFFLHIQTDLQREAIKAGYDSVISRSVFSRDLADILTGQQRGSTR